MLLNRKRFEIKKFKQNLFYFRCKQARSFCLTKQEEKAFYLLILSKNR